MVADLAAARREVDQLLATAPPAWRVAYARGAAAVVDAGLPAPGPLTREGALAILGITAGGRPSGDAARGPNAVPAAVRAEALEGLRLSHAHNYGAWHFIGIARAVQLATEPGVPDTTLARVRAYFSRHAADRDAPGYARPGAPSRGRLAWLNWGGDAAAAWAKAPVGGMMSGEHFGITTAPPEPIFGPEERAITQEIARMLVSALRIYAGMTPDLTISEEQLRELLTVTRDGAAKLDFTLFGITGSFSFSVAGVDEYRRGGLGWQRTKVLKLWRCSIQGVPFFERGYPTTSPWKPQDHELPYLITTDMFLRVQAPPVPHDRREPQDAATQKALANGKTGAISWLLVEYFKTFLRKAADGRVRYFAAARPANVNAQSISARWLTENYAGVALDGGHFGLTRAEDGDYFDEEAFDEILHYFKGALPRLSRGTLEVTSGGLTNGHPLTVGRILADNGSVFDYLLRVSSSGLSFAVQNTAYVERNVPTHHFWHASQPRLHPDGTTRPTRGALPGEAETIRKLLDGGYTLEIGNYLAFLVIFDRQMMRSGYHGVALGAPTFAARVRGIFAAFRR